MKNTSGRGATGKPLNVLRPKQRTFKKHTHGDGSIPSEIYASLLAGEDDAATFPRGGGSLLTQNERAEARAEAEQQFEREEESKMHVNPHKRGKQRSQAHYHGEDDFASLFGEGISGKLPRFANRITLKNISPNMKLWGVVAEVNLKDLVISLPGGLRGFVHPEDACDSFSDDRTKELETYLLCNIVHIGQLVPCIVKQVDDDKKDANGSKRIILSLRLSLLHKNLSLDSIQDGMVLNANVRTIEDHGYILKFGSSSFSGFLSKDGGGKSKLTKGQLIHGVVKSVDKIRAVVYLSSDADLISKSTVKDLNGLSVDSLVPGMMVNARIHATLQNGIMLSFLTFFTGTVDIFHMESLFPSTKWMDEYHKNKKVNARIIFIDPNTRAVGLTMRPHLIRYATPPSYAKTGDIFDNSKIVRVDKDVGLLLELPTVPEVSPTYISRFEVADKEVKNLEKKYKEGMLVRVRILGLRHLDGVAVGTLKASALEGSLFTHADIKPGMLARAKVIAVESFGAIVQFHSGVKALCPLSHMSELEITQPRKKFKIGAELLFRVLGCKSKRITVTCKKTLIKSKLAVVAAYADATEGLITHGWISKIEKHGCFLRFYNGVHGFASRHELGIEPESDPSSLYHIGQVVKCRVLSSLPAARRISVSFNLSSKRASAGDDAKLGSLVSGVVERLTSDAVIVKVDAPYKNGIIRDEHLADHHGQCLLIKSLLKAGHKFEQLLVLDVDASNIILSAKHSLITSSQELPVNFTQIQPHTVIHGYICNIIDTGIFVRFLGNLTGFCPLAKASDVHLDGPSNAFYVGQSVRTYITNVNSETGRSTLSLKQSCCFSTEASFIQGYFLLEEKMAQMQASDPANSYAPGVRDFSIGQLVEGEVQELKEYGVVLNFKDHSDVVGFIAHYQLCGKNVGIGQLVKAVVLDISASTGLVDLSLKPELLGSSKESITKHLKSKKKRQRESTMDLELHSAVSAVVEMVKENYLVLSVPQCSNTLGFASLTDYNTQRLPSKKFVEGQSVLATIEVLPSSSSSGRLLLLLKSLTEAPDHSSKRAKKSPTPIVGSLVQAEVIEIKPLNILLKFGGKSRGRAHITEVMDDICSVHNPLSNFKIGQVLKARVVGKAVKFGNGSGWELSLKPSTLAESYDVSLANDFNFTIGQTLRGFVVKVEDDWIKLMISRYVHAQIYVLDSSYEPSELQEFKKRFKIGDALSGCVIGLNEQKKLLRLMLRRSAENKITSDNAGSTSVNSNAAEHIFEGDFVGGKIKKILPGVAGLIVQIGPHLHGKVHYTELADPWTPSPLVGYQEGQFVKCKVLEISRSPEGFMHVDLSLRSFSGSSDSIQVDTSVEKDNSDTSSSTKRIKNVEELHPNMHVQGYIKNINEKGCFIMLSRKIDARILRSNLSNNYIENLEMEFPVGKLVSGRVLSVEALSKRVDVTLKTEDADRVSKSDLSNFCNLHVGDIITGKIQRTESYGLFIILDHTNLVGLCHKSNLPDPYNIESEYKAGDSVKVKILKVEKERRRISLGMKDLTEEGDTPMVENVTGTLSNTSDVSLPLIDEDVNFHNIPKIYSDQIFDNSRAFVPPLDVKLDEVSGSDIDDKEIGSEEHVVHDSTSNRKKRLTKKEKEERELAISASEERRLQNGAPKTVDDFEKLVRSSPNSSVVWINYMSLLISLADIEKARAVAERALRTINMREENEKLNVWVAYLNLENTYGSPPEVALKKIFQRALQHCDPLKLHMALLRIYEETNQDGLATELLETMAKKFKKSFEVWFRYAQCILKHTEDGVQDVVRRAILSLPKEEHIKFISQVAVLEFKHGSPDRGRTMFERVLVQYPRRTDMWSVYLDQEIRLGDKEATRNLFERATSGALKLKKMKFLLKKYLEYEKSMGDEERVKYVTRKAMEYVNAST